MDILKRQTKRIISIVLIIAILISVLPNFGLLNLSNATDYQSGVILRLNKGKGIWTDEYEEYNAISLDILIENTDVTSFVLPIKFDPSKLTPAYYYVGRRDEYIDIATNAKEFTSEMNSELPNTFNANDQTSDTNWLNVEKGKIILEFLDSGGKSYSFNNETLICTINFIVSDEITDINEIDTDMINIDEDSNSFEIFNFETKEYKVDVNRYFSLQGINILPTVKSLSVKTNPTEGKNYLHGEKIDLAGGELLATYTDDSTKEISMLDEEVRIITGEKEGAIADIENPKLTFEYKKASTELEVNVIDPIESIVFFDKNNIMKDYKFYDGDELPKEELFIKAITKSGNENIIPLSDSRISLNSDIADISKVKDLHYNTLIEENAGIQKIEITYEDEEYKATTSFNLIVNDSIGEIKISTTNPPEGILTVGELFTKSGAIEIIGRSGISYGEIEMSSGDVTVTEVDGSEVDLSKPETGKTLKVTYSGASTTYTVNVEDTVKEIRVNGSAKTEYNEMLKASDFAGITVTEIMASGNEGATKDLDFGWINISTYDNTTIDRQNLKVNYPYSNKVVEGLVTVQVKDKLLGITIENLKTDYVYKDELDYEGAELYLEYVKGIFGPRDMSDLEVSGFDSTKIGKQELTFTYNDGIDEVSTKVSVNVGKATPKAPECEQLTIVEGIELSTIQDQLPTTEYGSVIWKTPTQKLTYVEGSNNIHEIEAVYKMNDTYSPYYNDVELKVKVEVVEKTLAEIKITTPPIKVEYIEGQTFEKAGMVVTAVYDNGEEKEVTDYTIVNETRKLTTTDTKMIISYKGETAEQAITVREKTLIGIEITEAPTKTNYIEGQKFEKAGMVVKAVYDNGEKQEITDYTITDETRDLTTLDTKMIINYNGQTAEQAITVAEKKVTSIEITTKPTTLTYVEGQSFDPTGMIVTAHYDNGTSAETTNYTITPAGALTPANTTITINYTGADIADDIEAPTANVAITVNERAIESIAITKPANCVSYIEGQDFDPAGMEITVTYNDHVNPLIINSDYAIKGVTFAPATNLQTTDNNILVSYRGKTADQVITVIPDFVVDITVTAPTKLTYNYGDSIDLANATITKVWASGIPHANDTIPMTLNMVSGYNMTSLGNQGVTVTYDTIVKTNAFQITVNDIVDRIEIEDKTKLKTEYEYGDIINVVDKDTGSKLYVLVKYAGGTPDKKVELTTDMLSGFNMSKVENNQTVTVTYEGKTDTYEINVKDKVIGIDIAKEPAKKVYKLNETINFSDIEVVNVMASGAKGANLTTTEYTISAVDTTSVGEKEVIVTKTGTAYTDTFKVKVIDATTAMFITTLPKTDYKYGEGLNLTGGEITITTQTGTQTKAMTDPSVTVTGYNKNLLGNQTLTVTYTYNEETDNGIETKTMTDTYTITVEDYVIGIAITKNPDKLTYEYGEDIELAGGKVAEKMASGTTRNEVAITGEMISGYNKEAEGTQTITVEYLGKTTNFNVTVKDLIKGISMKTLPNKTEYTQGEAIDVSGAVLNVTKSSGIREIAVTKEMISGYDPNKVGTQVITVTYNGFSTEFVVNVKAKTVIKPTNPVNPSKPNKPNNPANPTEPSTSEVVKYTVTFIDYDGSLLKTEEVEAGKPATAPELADRDGYRFIGWDSKFDTVEEDIIVMAEYEKIKATPKPSEKPSEVLGVKDEVDTTENDITKNLVPALAGVTVSGLLLLLIAAITKKNVEIYAVIDGERKLLGKEKITKKYAVVSIDKYKEDLGKGNIEVVLNSRISKKLNGENVDIILNEKELTYKVRVNDNEAFVIEIKNK